MPTIVELLAHPERRRPSPPAPRANLARVLLAGMAVWAVALVVALVMALTGAASWSAVAICGTGLALGAPGILWARRRKA
ncbi:DUF2530 domain-containing protein [Myceligenerans pegani]|uniref:DUF2530 domain-containing protein n=1 Tax=Myceligenerans pegani TaxID=2776917 RepID=A0ABR9MV00_9MICO|nr:DUF2530 domain-containing protein [Myceligenerans sp. TRM 65318]MBE1875219.1 DUF2530 domain-containing protein [Myceligenerans sp. TRM 65318]MBE3017490.1 DUF2530 domain-containing protein [Myceligenerans sp. TRM 65318]